MLSVCACVCLCLRVRVCASVCVCLCVCDSSVNYVVYACTYVVWYLYSSVCVCINADRFWNHPKNDVHFYDDGLKFRTPNTDDGYIVCITLMKSCIQYI